jgi:hypothetical protein
VKNATNELSASRRNNRAVTAAAALGLALLLAACTATGDAGGAPAVTETAGGLLEATASYDDNGVTLEYPAEWRTLDQTTQAASVGNELWSQGFGPSETGANVAILKAYQLQLDVTDVPAEDLMAEIDATLDRLTEQTGGSRVGEVTASNLGSLSGFEATVNSTGPSGQLVESRVVFAFDRDVEYFLNCQYEPDARSEIIAGCDTIQRSFAVR